MEKEVFERQEVADLLGRGFVSIKVDREERPDLDAAYMEALQMMTGSGGWPMSLFLTPDGRPFFGATYIPADRFLEVCRTILRVYHEQRESVARQSDLFSRSVAAGLRLDPADVDDELIDHAAKRALELVDEQWGGIGGPPKFPTPPRLSFLLHRFRRTGDPRLAAALRLTLDAMASGGIRDQLGGGFHRYSVDARWVVPHFEKMLYDNAQLASLYLDPTLTGIRLSRHSGRVISRRYSVRAGKSIGTRLCRFCLTARRTGPKMPRHVPPRDQTPEPGRLYRPLLPAR
jgi:uncharacterized protein YyaL (SSP411 family)